MSASLTSPWTDVGARSEPASQVRSARIFAFACLAAALSFVSFRTQLIGVWQTGAFFDTDDATRLVQVRALLGGQHWFDMAINGMDPPHGVFMHWTRIVDVPVAVLIKTFGFFVQPSSAELLARLAFPFLLLIGLYLGLARLACLLLGPTASIPMMAAGVLSGNGIGQFLPGRIAHHAPEIVTLAFMVGCAIAALDTRYARQAAISGALVALSLAISLENLPFIAVLITALVAIWAWHGQPTDRMLGSFAAGLGAGLLFFFALTVGPDHYTLAACDAFGAAHLGAGLIIAVGCGVTVRIKPPTRLARFGVAIGIAVCAAGYVAVCYPACFGSPFAGVDPLVREIWMTHVEESKPFLVLLQDEPNAALTAFGPVVLGLIGCLFATWRTRGLQRLGFAIVTAIVAIGLAMAFWQVRVLTSVAAIALYGGLYVAVSGRTYWLRRRRKNLASLAWLLLFPFTAMAVGLVVPAEAQPDPDERVSGRCLRAAAYAPLAELPNGRVLAPADLGSFFLTFTDLPVFAAAYHRNNDGNRFAFDAMLAPPPLARDQIRARKTRYIVMCPGISETKRLAERAPDGLAAALRSGRIPDWLRPIPLKNTPLKVFEVVRNDG